MKYTLRLCAIAAACTLSAAAQASITVSYVDRSVQDSDTGLTWQYFATTADGAAKGFEVATAAQTSQLFVHYAPTSDGQSFDVPWTWNPTTPPGSGPLSLVAGLYRAGGNFSYGGTFGGTDGLIAAVADGDSWASVLLTGTNTCSQYQSCWGAYHGEFNPDPARFAGVTYRDQYGQELPNPYLTDTGALKIGGYLMVKGVPEPSTYVLVGLGLGAAGLVARKRRAGA